MSLTKSPWFTYFVLLFSVFVVIEAAAFQTPAMPFITEHFGVSITFAGSITLAYYAAAVVFSPLMGRIGDQIGRKEILVVGLIIFTFSEFLAALSPNYVIFLFARFLQGVGYACIFPTVFAYISELFDETKSGKAIAYLGITGAVGAASGGIIAGFLMELYNWPIIYWVSGVSSFIGLFIIIAVIPKTTVRQKQQIDFKGAFALLLAICSLVSIPILVSNFGLVSTVTLTVITIGIVGFVLLILAERKAINPVVDIQILKRRGIYVPSMIAILLTFATIALNYALAFYTASRVGWGPTEVGLITTINYSLSIVGNFVSGLLIDRYNPRLVILGGGLIGIFGSIMYTLISTDSNYIYLLLTIGVIGLCTGLLNPALMKIVILSVPTNLKGTGSGTFTMFRDLGVPLGSSFGLALYGFMSERQLSLVSDPTVATANALNSVGYVVIGIIILIILVSLLLFRKEKRENTIVETRGAIQLSE
ncbi:MAG: MFS transporter [Lysinibacillus sp.]